MTWEQALEKYKKFVITTLTFGECITKDGLLITKNKGIYTYNSDDYVYICDLVSFDCLENIFNSITM